MCETNIITTRMTIPDMISKTEMFDEDVLKTMLKDTRISKEDRNVLSTYFKRFRSAPSTAIVTYSVSASKLGRYYATNGLSIGVMRWDLRSPLLQRYYWDTDFANCHFVIASELCKRFGLRCDAIDEYISNRDDILRKVHTDRYIAKTVLLAVGLYGGDINLHTEGRQYGGENPNIDSLPFIRRLQSETKHLADYLWLRNQDKHKLGKTKDKKQYKDRINGAYALMSLLIQDEERHCLFAWDEFLQKNGRSLDILIHDGGCVRKQEGETEFPEILLRNGEEYVFQRTKYRHRLAVKTFQTGWTAPIESTDIYGGMKTVFEEQYALVGDVFYDRGERFCPPTTMKAMNTLMANKILYEDDEHGKRVKAKFLTKWLEDPERKSYKRADFIPNVDECPSYVYNLFGGLRGEKIEAEVEEDEIPTLIAPIMRHIDLLTEGHSDYTCKWLANIIQRPEQKSHVGIFLRDMGGLLYEGGGTGKNIFLDWVGNKILGKELYLMIGNNSDLYGAFNGMLEGVLLCVVEEASGRDNHRFVDLLKAKITAETTLINKKGINQYRVNDYTRFIFCSNNPNPLPIFNGDRRFTAFDVNSTHRNDPEYFGNLVRVMNDERVQKAFFMYLKQIYTYTTPNEFSINRPITEAYRNIKQLNAPSIYKWLLALLNSNEPMSEPIKARRLYNKYKDWCQEHDKSDSVISETLFGKRMKEVLNAETEHNEYQLSDSIGSHSHTREGTMYSINCDKLREGFIKLHLLSPKEDE